MPKHPAGTTARSLDKLINLPWRLIASVFLPFTLGYYLAYLFRTINTSISDALTAEFGLGAAELGLLTSVYFLVFAGAQIPVGAFLDRYGPRRVQGVLLVMAAGGATLFGTASGFPELLAGRAMIGLGVAGSLMAGLKAIVMWFPKERIALVNGYMIMLGALGAVTATAPAAWLEALIGWRGLFEVLTLAAAVIAGIIYFLVPEHHSSFEPSYQLKGSLTLRTVYSDARFWRIAPLSATCIGSSWAMQSLWAAPWLADVEGLDRPSVFDQLLFMAIGLSIGALLLGTVADRLRRRGISTEAVFAAVALALVAAHLLLIIRVPVPSLLPWSVIAVTGAATVLSFAVMADYFPSGLAARANGALNLLHFGCTFAVQYGIGLIIGQWVPQDGHYALVAYQIAFSLPLALQLLALIWFVIPWCSTLIRRYAGSSPNTYYPSDHLEWAVAPAEGAIFHASDKAEW